MTKACPPWAARALSWWAPGRRPAVPDAILSPRFGESVWGGCSESRRGVARGISAGNCINRVLQCRRSIRGYTGQLRHDAVARGKCRHQDVRMRQGAAGLLRRCGPRVRSRMDCGGPQAVKVRAKGLWLALCGGVDGPRGEMASSSVVKSAAEWPSLARIRACRVPFVCGPRSFPAEITCWRKAMSVYSVGQA